MLRESRPLPIAMLVLAGAAEARPAGPVGPGEVLTLGTGLVLVVFAILLTGWLYSRTQRLRGAGGNLIRVVASQPLGTRERVVLLEVAGKQLLVGMTTSSVQTLHVFEEPVAGIPPEPSGFADRLRQAVRGASS